MNETNELVPLLPARLEWPTTLHLAALRRLWAHAQGETGQSRVTSAFLLGLYNGRRFPFDLTNFRLLDNSLICDCLAVLEMDSTPKREVHDLLGAPNHQFEALASYWGHADIQRLRAGDANRDRQG